MSRIFISLLAGITAVFIHGTAGEIEGRLFPVMGRLTIYDPEPFPPPDYRTRFRGRAVKRRNCEFVRVEWFLGPRDGAHVEVRFEYTDPPMLRATGEHAWNGILIHLSPDVVLSNSHADVLHRCPWRPWLTRTPYYDAARR